MFKVLRYFLFNAKKLIFGTKFSYFEAWFLGTWLPEITRWELDDLIKCNTNNGTKRINEELKYEDLSRCVNLPISEWLTIIIEKFLPGTYERYVEMNVQFSSDFKKYQSEIPSYLSNRSRIILEDILSKMKQVSPAMTESLQPMSTVPKTTFLVRGDSTHGTEMKTYCVDFGTKENFLRCSCR